MTGSSREDQAVTDSGGTRTRLIGPPQDVIPDPYLLEARRSTAYDDPVQPAGARPTWNPGRS